MILFGVILLLLEMLLLVYSCSRGMLLGILKLQTNDSDNISRRSLRDIEVCLKIKEKVFFGSRESIFCIDCFYGVSAAALPIPPLKSVDRVFLAIFGRRETSTSLRAE